MTEIGKVEPTPEQGVDEEFIRRKTDELMCDVDSGDELANYDFLLSFAKQLLKVKE